MFKVGFFLLAVEKANSAATDEVDDDSSDDDEETEDVGVQTRAKSIEDAFVLCLIGYFCRK